MFLVFSLLLLAASAASADALTPRAFSICATPGQCRTRPTKVENPASQCVTGADAACGCVASTTGVACAECSYGGYISSEGICVCASNQLDPRRVRPCTPPVNTSFGLQFTTDFAVASCACHFSKELGLFGSSLPPPRVYGEDPPQTCDICKHSAAGPPTHRVVQTTQTPPQACLQIGGVDPNAYGTNSTYWTACSSHGTWAASKFRCECAPQWSLVDTGLPSLYGINATTCGASAPFWGPQAQGGGPPPYSYTPWTPDPLTGVAASCGGHGALQPDASCACFNNGTAGHWALGNVTTKFTTLQYLNDVDASFAPVTRAFTIKSCVVCASGWGTPTTTACLHA